MNQHPGVKGPRDRRWRAWIAALFVFAVNAAFWTGAAMLYRVLS
jgi:hypothetical protein